MNAKKAPKAVKAVRKILSPMENFLKMESSSGIILLAVAVIAMILANSPLYEIYNSIIHFKLGVKIGATEVSHSFQHWVNDGLMVIFFFVVGLEIKRELIQGELSSPGKAALPMFAALGGMVAPALIYLALNPTYPGHAGWGIPMATDIAFAVGILTLFSKKVPFTLKIFLLALAIVDDLGAILVIAFFYTESIHQFALGMAAIGIAVITIMKYSGVRQIALYSVVGFLVWIAILKSGVHATISGVIMGLLTPVAALFPKKELPSKFRTLANEIASNIENEKNNDELSSETLDKIHDLHTVTVESSSPLDRLIHMLHPFVSFIIMPIFAFVNAGVHIENISVGDFFSNHISLGIILGLVVGKPVGVMLFSFLAIKLKLARLPKGVTWGHMLAVGFLAGIGFTMALFISNLALHKVPDLEMFSKLGILTASIIAGVIGSVLLIFSKDPKEAK